MKTYKDLIAEVPVITRSRVGLDRSAMPQIRSKYIPDFINFLKKKGISVTQTKTALSTLKPTQNKVETEKILKKFLEPPEKITPFLVSSDRYILDGHHRLYALRASDPKQNVPAYLINIKMQELLDLAKLYPKTTYKPL